MKNVFSLTISGILFLLTISICQAQPNLPMVSQSEMNMIETLFKGNGLSKAGAMVDHRGRIQLKGEYQDSREVSLAFSLTQSVVGTNRVSPVTPENIKVKDWARKLSTFFPTKEIVPIIKNEKLTGDGFNNKYALVVGVGHFKNDITKKNELQYAVNDAQKVYSYLSDPKQGGFNRKNITLLLNENATISDIQKTLDNMRNDADQDDDIFIYFSSHGIPIYDGSLNIIVYETVFKNHFSVAETSFPTSSLRTFLSDTNARHVMIVLDVCYSGAVFNKIDGFYQSGSKSISFDDDNQGFSKNAMAKNLLGAKDITLEDEVVSTSATSTNRTNQIKIIISASGEGEKSWESDNLKSSFFTYYFVKELEKGSGVKNAFDTAKPVVKKNVKEEKGNDQNPQVIVSNPEWNIMLSEQ